MVWGTHAALPTHLLKFANNFVFLLLEHSAGTSFDQMFTSGRLFILSKKSSTIISFCGQNFKPKMTYFSNSRTYGLWLSWRGAVTNQSVCLRHLLHSMFYEEHSLKIVIFKLSWVGSCPELAVPKPLEINQAPLTLGTGWSNPMGSNQMP